MSNHISAASERGDHDDKSTRSDFVVFEFLGLFHLLAGDDELELFFGHSFLILDGVLEHGDCVVALVVDTEFPVGDCFNLEVWHFITSNNY